MQAFDLKALFRRGGHPVQQVAGQLRPDPSDSRYRADVDGLRAIAVVPVVLFHAGFRFMSGGFVGVDVFFVISGFLITGILAREIGDGSYSILEFYRRRARRIFPALTAMTLATLLVGYVILMPSDYVELAKSALGVSVFASNIYFWKSVSYFKTANEFRPLLHTWSLAVEEQYYLVFPLLLRLLNVGRKGIVAALWFICISSFVLSAWLVPWKPSAAFYLLPARAWELMLGGILAVGEMPRPGSDRIASIASTFGLLLIAVPMFVYTGVTPFPGFAAVPPTLGTALIIWSGGQGVIGAGLSRPWVVAVGKASYSIYLWHLPLLAFAAYLVAGPLSTTAALLLCAVSIGLGFASLELVERPFRSPASRWTRNRAAAYAACGMPVIASISLLIIAGAGLPARLSASEAKLVAVADDKYRHHAECMTLDEKTVPPDHACRLGAQGAPPTVLLWGDSHSMVTATALEQAAIRRRASFLFAADADCPPGLGFSISETVSRSLTSQLSYRYCAAYNLAMLRMALESKSITTVVFSARWTNWRIGEPGNPIEGNVDVRLRDSSGLASTTYANRGKWERGFFALIDRLTARGKKVIIVGPLPEPTFDVPRRLYVERFGFAGRSNAISLSQYERRHRTILRIFATLKGKQGVQFIWPAQALCSGDQCPLVEHGTPLYFDQDHLSVDGALKTSRLYDFVFDRSIVTRS